MISDEQVLPGRVFARAFMLDDDPNAGEAWVPFMVISSRRHPPRRCGLSAGWTLVVWWFTGARKRTIQQVYVVPTTKHLRALW